MFFRYFFFLKPIYVILCNDQRVHNRLLTLEFANKIPIHWVDNFLALLFQVWRIRKLSYPLDPYLYFGWLVLECEQPKRGRDEGFSSFLFLTSSNSIHTCLSTTYGWNYKQFHWSILRFCPLGGSHLTDVCLMKLPCHHPLSPKP